MVTMVGNEDTLAELLQNLLVLEYDAIEAYEACIERLETPAYVQKLREFHADHLRHVEKLRTHLQEIGAEVPMDSDTKALLTKGKIVIADLMGDDAILKAMKTNEDDTITAYDKASRNKNATAAVLSTLQEGLADERKHRSWMESSANRKAA